MLIKVLNKIMTTIIFYPYVFSHLLLGYLSFKRLILIL